MLRAAGAAEGPSPLVTAITFAVKHYMLREGIDVYTAASEAINMVNMTTTEICIGVLKDATKGAGGEAADDSEGKAQEGEGKYDYESSLWSKYDYEARKYDYEKRPCASGGPHSWKQYDYAAPCGECGGAITMWCKWKLLRRSRYVSSPPRVQLARPFPYSFHIPNTNDAPPSSFILLPP